MNIRLYQDSRDKHSFQRFGSAVLTELPVDKNFDDVAIPEKIQPISNVQCGIFSADYLIKNKYKMDIDFDELWSRVPHSRFGVIPNELFGTILDYVMVNGQKFKPYNSYYRADTDPLYDKFDSTRSAQIQVDSPVIMYSNWYQNWLNLGPNAVMPIGENSISGHLYVGKGWFEGENFIIEWWGGYTMTMPRATFNKTLSALGCGAVVFSTVEQDEKRKKTIMEKIIDACKNIILLLKQQMNQQPVTVSSSQKLYDLSFSLIGKHLSLDDSVPHEFGCAQALSKVLLLAGYPIPKGGISGTIAMNNWLAKNFTEVSTPQMGDVIISLTNGNIHGHCGVNGKDAIMSNDSLTGNWQPYWSLAGWLNSYKNTEHLVTKYYRTP